MTGDLESKIKISKGVYILEFFLSLETFIDNKNFSNYKLPNGWYYYFGSAQKNLFSRISRHIAKYKRKHWHIDYISSNKNFSINRVYIFENAIKKYECFLTRLFEKKLKLTHILKRFGNGDCENKCLSHMLYSKEQITKESIFNLTNELKKINIIYIEQYNFFHFR